jgi:hypothetical protein
MKTLQESPIVNPLRKPAIVVGLCRHSPPPAMPTYLSVKEAAQLTGKSPSSIRRVIYPIIQDDHHPERLHILPTPEEVVKLRMKGENFAWRLSEELLRRKLPIEPGSEKTSGPSQKSSTHPEADLLAMLRRELDIKNQQITQQSELIAKQMELVTGLSERLREGNILLGSLQQRLTLSDGREHTTTATTGTKRGTSAQAEKGSNVAGKSGKPKKSFLARIFG